MARTPRAGRRNGAQKPGRLRIVAGKWRRRLLPVVDVAGLRPTPERIRETLFNWLSPRIDGARCLDLCAGSGALGFEALSRGARRAVLVERAPTAVRGLRESARLLEAGDDVQIVAGDALQFLSRQAGEQFDLVFLDPPFKDALLPDLCRLLHEGNWLADSALVYLERDRGMPTVALPPGWTVVKQSAAGNVSCMLLSPGQKEDGLSNA